MPPESKTCQNCKKNFTIESEDFDFYKKISVPPPTFCPECRLQRRLSFFNPTTLYKRPCGLCKKDFISMYHPDVPHTIYCPKCWWGDGWDPKDYGRNYDFSKPFFEQFKELFQQVPLLGTSLGVDALVTSPYCNHGDWLKNCYLLFDVTHAEHSAYCFYGASLHTVFDCAAAALCEKSYDCINLFKSHNCVGCRGNVAESINCFFCRDCVNCQDCFGCASLYNKQFCFFNEQLTKETYQEKIKEFDLGSYKGYEEARITSREFWRTVVPRPVYISMSPNSTGNYIFSSKNCKESFDVANAEDCKFLLLTLEGKTNDAYDVSVGGMGLSECYEVNNVAQQVKGIKFSQETGRGIMDAEYCKVCIGSSKNLFGCIGFKNGRYLILNKQYEKEEYESMVEKIKQQMMELPYKDIQGREYRYGEFFPCELSPFSYSGTLAQNFFPMSEEDIKREGYTYYSDSESSHVATIQAKDLPDHIKDVTDAILNEVIACGETGKAYKIQPMELEFLRSMNLPLPRLAPLPRIRKRINEWAKQRKLIERKSSKSGEILETHYTEADAPDVLTMDEYKQEYL